MKHILILITAITLVGCSSLNYIETDKYSEIVRERCLSKSGNPNQKKCAMKSMTSVQFASRMYETRAKSDYNECVKDNAVKQDQDACFENKQKLYYNNYFKVK